MLQKVHQGKGSPAQQNIPLKCPWLSRCDPGAPRLSLQEAGKPSEIAALSTSSEGPPTGSLESFPSAAWPETLQRVPVRRGKGRSLLS